MNQAAIPEGTAISHYRILSRIGVGGMGEVYLALDTTLERTVALKILPADLAANQQSMRRFIQEAKTASGLTHPNIITIYEIGQQDTLLFIATEYVEGENLRQHLSRTTLTIPEVLDITIQAASALSAAHDAGVIHRDIKPENLMLRRDSILKVLDFGLAKLTETGDPEVNRRATTMIETLPGTVLGTTAYMSPEQARGRELDARTDIWSLGVVLYELVTGRVAFEHETASDIIASILTNEPQALSALMPEVPPELERIVGKALAKDRDERYQGVKDLLVDLKRLKKRLEFESELQLINSGRTSAASTNRHITSSGQIQSTGPVAASNQIRYSTSSAEYIVTNIKEHKKYAVSALVLFALVAALGVYGLYRFVVTTPAVVRAINVTRFTATGKAVHAAISPDGKYVAHVADDAGQQSVWIGQVAAASEVQIIPPAAVEYRGLSFTPDGNFLYYVSADKDDPRGALYQIPIFGGASRKLVENVQSPVALSPDGKQVAFVRYSSPKEDALMVAKLDGSEEKKLAAHASPDFFSTMAPAWSPDGSVIACVYQNTSGGYYENVVGVRVNDGTEAPITPQRWWQIGQVAWLADGKGLIASATEDAGSLAQLWYIPYGGTPKRLTNDLNGYTDASLTADSKTLVSVRSDRLVNIWLANAADPNNLRRITSGAERDDGMRGLSWTNDGRLLYRSLATGEPNVWIMGADGTGQKQLSLHSTQNFDPMVSPDGREIVWASRRTGNTNLWKMSLDGNNETQLTNGVGEYFPEYSPDGKWILYTAYDPGSGFWSVWKIPAVGGAPVRMTDSESALSVISPDGKFFACNYLRDAGYAIAVVPFEGGPPIKIFNVPGSFGRTIHWVPDGRALSYVDTKAGVSNIWIQSLSGGEPQPLTNFKDQRIFGFAWSRDGKQLALSRGVVNSDVVLLKQFGP